MSQPPTMSQLLKRAGLAKRPRPGRSTIEVAPKASKPPISTMLARVKVEIKAEQGNGDVKEADIGGGNAVDDQIAALERELGSGSDCSSDDDTSSSTGSEDSEDGRGEQDSATAGGHQRVLKLVSPLAAEKIEPLPSHLLPRPGCGVSKANKSAKKAKKRPKIASEAPAEASAPGPSRGLDSAVQELMANYEARSSERVPFYCRVCKFQGDSLEALERHKQEPLHVEATKKERKISTCSLCKKQFTSPPQLKEHLAGKAHLERLQSTMSRQGKWVPGRGAGSDAGGYSNGTTGDSYARSGGWAGGRGQGRGRGGRGRGRGRGERGRIGPGRG